MNKIQKFALTLSIALAATLTFSCSSDSSDDDDDVGRGLSGLHAQPNQQVYNRDGEAFNGNGDVVMIVEKWDGNSDNLLYRDTLHAGKIENGKITLDLPKSIDSKYFVPAYDNICEELEGILGARGNLYTNTSDGLCMVMVSYGYEEERAELFYSQNSEKVKCNHNETYEGNTIEFTLDLNLSKGWNTIYWHSEDIQLEGGNMKYKYNSSNNPNVIKSTLKWQLSKCN